MEKKETADVEKQAPQGQQTQPTPKPLTQTDSKEYRKRREAGEGVDAEVFEQPTAPEPEIEPTPAAAQSGEAKSVAERDTAEEEGEKKEKPKSRYDRRIDQLIREKFDEQRRADEAEARLAKLVPREKPSEPADKPKVDSYETYEEYVDALTDWKIAKKDQERSRLEALDRARENRRSFLSTWRQKVEVASKKYDDFEETLDSDLVLSREMTEAIMDSDLGCDIAYYLGKHPEEAERIFKLSPYATVREIGKIEHLISSNGTPKQNPSPVSESQPVSKTPKPITPVKAGGSANKLPLSQVQPDEYRRRRESGEGT